MKQSKAFTLVEMMISLAIFGVVTAGTIRGMIHIGKGITRTRDLVETRMELTNFANSLYVFGNKSIKVYFDDSSADKITKAEFFNLTHPLSVNSYSWLDEVFFVKPKDTNGNQPNDAKIRYMWDATKQTGSIGWFKTITSTNHDVMLEKVFRTDATWNDDGTLKDPGKNPVFRFPHNVLWDSVTQGPKFIVLDFLRVVSEGTNIVTIPVTLTVQVNTIE